MEFILPDIANAALRIAPGCLKTYGPKKTRYVRIEIQDARGAWAPLRFTIKNTTIRGLPRIANAKFAGASPIIGAPASFLEEFTNTLDERIAALIAPVIPASATPVVGHKFITLAGIRGEIDFPRTNSAGGAPADTIADDARPSKFYVLNKERTGTTPITYGAINSLLPTGTKVNATFLLGNVIGHDGNDAYVHHCDLESIALL